MIELKCCMPVIMGFGKQVCTFGSQDNLLFSLGYKKVNLQLYKILSFLTLFKF